ncbi:MlaD family protein [Acetobacter thailandicus]|uniref:MlaD family protein n=1 Tax=Acetobacter thailandicus TaxID=1502842 RepID=UPI001BA9CDE8|nr:MlaD family protein [Acetobacter thailandicus]MBS0980851.1 MCE family protein [Acetobacter thailandicus]
MADTHHRKTLLGVFVTGGAALGLGIIISFGHMRLFTPTREAVVIFQSSINGLSLGAPVTFRGVKVGSVQNIKLSFDPQDYKAYIPVTITLDPDQVHVVDGSNKNSPVDVNKLIANGLHAELNMQSFVTGQYNINLDFDKNAPRNLHPRIATLPEIPVRLSDVEKLRTSLGQIPFNKIADRADNTLASANLLLASLNKDLPPLISSLKTTSDDSHQTLTVTTEAIRNLQKKLDATLIHLDTLLETSNSQLNSRGEDLHKTLVSATKTLDSLQGMLSPRSVDRANMDAALRDIAAAAASLRGFAGDVERNPQLLLMGRRK